MGTTYSMNYINNNDAFLLAKEISAAGNPYGLSSSADSHLMKDSEWGAVAYLSQSKYGLDGTNIAINNISLNGGGKTRTSEKGQTGVESVYAMTGVTTNDIDEKEKVISGTKEIVNKINKVTGDTPTIDEGIYTWEQKTGTKASSTGTIYGIYDLSGGVLEKTASYIDNKNENLSKYGASLTGSNNTAKRTKYTMVYVQGKDDTNELDYAANKEIFGNAIGETSKKSKDMGSWYTDRSVFVNIGNVFSTRGGLWSDEIYAGMFFFANSVGASSFTDGFRVVLVGT